eukprot:11198096-Lingulodinium_polyedra.AAC.1
MPGASGAISMVFRGQLRVVQFSLWDAPWSTGAFGFLCVCQRRCVLFFCGGRWFGALVDMGSAMHCATLSFSS